MPTEDTRAAEVAATNDPIGCWCQRCRDFYALTLPPIDRIAFHGSRMVVCPDCGNKRCPKANFHGNACTASNAVGQPGSSWENVKPFAKTDETPPAPPLVGEGAGGEGLEQAHKDIDGILIAGLGASLSMPLRKWLADLHEQNTEAARELSYERQMRQQTEQAMITLATEATALRARLQEAKDAGAAKDAGQYKPVGAADLVLWLTDEDRADIRSGCDPQATHFNDSADVKVDLVVKMLGYVEQLEFQLAETQTAYAGALKEWKGAAGNCVRLLKERDAAQQGNAVLRAKLAQEGEQER